MSSSSQPLKQQIQDAIDTLPPNLLPLLLNLIHLLRSHYPTPTFPHQRRLGSAPANGRNRRTQIA
ncbi:hypothetical protein [Prochlorothrix hollandica]|uniref:Uncharacterized protein n=1 Tax=Prochlorothrix hollandica PCC 9006 = CALU 1027 TaxID=317619 RepID=A0A0M2PX02_PROHO|nr:hypothetical protein [Prochlorothrix hollandica]KKJ00705.1 hypothetical protein PROH_05315 [Prochlorothrix hollandica PCC 9006 = CALU 1027]